MTTMNDSALRVEIALRGARLAKSALELMSLSPDLVRLQLCEIVKQVREIDALVVAKKGGAA
jgi:predicted RNase H-like nuclease